MHANPILEAVQPPVGAGRALAVGHPWLILAVVFLASVAAVLAQFAAPPLMPLLMADFGIDLTRASSLMSVFSITGVILALPAGMILQRFGPVATGAVAMTSVVAGSVLGSLAPDYGVLLASRALQGVGLGLIGVTAPAVVAASFPPERRGGPMGVWAMWVPVGGVIMYNVAPPIGAAYGWQAAWWLAAVVAAVSLVLYVAVLSAGLPRATRDGGGATAPSMRVSLAGRDIWILAATFGLFALSASGINTFMPTFLVEQRGFDLAGAASMASLVLVGAMAGSVLGGLVSDRIGSRRLVYTVPAIAMAVLWALPFNVEGAGLPVVLLVVGVCSGAIPTAIFASVPEVMRDPRLIGAGMAALLLGQNAGFVVGPVVFGALVTATAWVAAGYVFAGFSLAGAVVGWRARVR